MARRIVTPDAGAPDTTSEETSRTRRLLACGIVAGPLFLVVALVQALTRDGFDLSRHPISLLSLGELGWIQIANFIVTGGLYVACAVGMRRVLRQGRGATWGPRLVGALGIGLIMGGVFLTDAGAGFPPGAPAGAPEQVSWHGMLHNLAPILAMDGMVIGCLVFARRFAALGQRSWAAAGVATAVAVVALTWWPDLDGISVRLVIAQAILFGFVGALAGHLMAGLPATAGRPSRGSRQQHPAERRTTAPSAWWQRQAEGCDGTFTGSRPTTSVTTYGFEPRRRCSGNPRAAEWKPAGRRGARQ